MNLRSGVYHPGCLRCSRSSIFLLQLCLTSSKLDQYFSKPMLCNLTRGRIWGKWCRCLPELCWQNSQQLPGDVTFLYAVGGGRLNQRTFVSTLHESGISTLNMVNCLLSHKLTVPLWSSLLEVWSLVPVPHQPLK